VAAPPYKGPEFVKLILHFTMLWVHIWFLLLTEQSSVGVANE
jgi:hypothetical protein